MFGLKWNWFVSVAILATLGAQDLVCGQSQNPPPVVAGAASVPQFRPLTEADIQDALAQVKVATAALNQRFATAGPSADGWKKYLSWDNFNGELPKAKPDNAVLGDVYKKLASGYEGLELKCFANLRTALGNYLLAASLVGNPDVEAASKTQVDDLTQQIKSLSTIRRPTKPARSPTISSGWKAPAKRQNWCGKFAGGFLCPISTPSLAASCWGWPSAGRSTTWPRSTT